MFLNNRGDVTAYTSSWHKLWQARILLCPCKAKCHQAPSKTHRMNWKSGQLPATGLTGCLPKGCVHKRSNKRSYKKHHSMAFCLSLDPGPMHWKILAGQSSSYCCMCQPHCFMLRLAMRLWVRAERPRSHLEQPAQARARGAGHSNPKGHAGKG